MFFAPRGIATREQADEWLRAELGSEAAAGIGVLYGLDADVPAPVALTKLTGDALFGMGTRAMLRAAARYSPNVYQYEFTRVSPLASRMRLNAYHGADLAYSFGTLPESVLMTVVPGITVSPGDYDEKDEQVSRAMSGAVVQFVSTGDPNRRGLPRWSRFGSDENYLEYGDSFVQKQELRSAYLDALDAIFAVKRSADSAR